MGTPLGSFLCPPGFTGPSGLRAIARESSVLAEAARFVRSDVGARRRRRNLPYATRAPERALDPVVLVPGFLAGDGSLSLMSRHLRGLGYRTYRSHMRANVGCSQAASRALEQRVEAVAGKRGRRVTLVGHSLGGLMARGIAAKRPDLVDSVVTLGSPMLAPGAAHPILLFDLRLVTRLQRAGLGGVMGEDCTSGRCARLSWDQTRASLAGDVSFTSVFSRRDGVIDWRSCLDPQATTVEVSSSHLGMALDPAVLGVVSDALVAHREHLTRVSQPARWVAAPDASAG
jgi:pimeloyl-ACP methyl ester carboxylesterase